MLVEASQHVTIVPKQHMVDRTARTIVSTLGEKGGKPLLHYRLMTPCVLSFYSHG